MPARIFNHFSIFFIAAAAAAFVVHPYISADPPKPSAATPRATTQPGELQKTIVVAQPVSLEERRKKILAATDPQVIKSLDAIEAAAKDLKTFQTDLVYNRINTLLQDRQTRTGKLTFINEKPRQFIIHFDKKIINRALRDDVVTFAFDGTWLTEHRPAEKIFIKRQMVAPGESFDPLKLGEGPIPIPIGQQRNNVLDLYQTTLIPPGKFEQKRSNKKHLANAFHLRLIPHPDAPAGGDDRLSQIDIWYDKTTYLPLFIQATDGESALTEVRLKNPKINAIVQDAKKRMTRHMTPPPAGSGYQVEITPLKSNPPVPPAPPATPGSPKNPATPSPPAN